MISCKTMTKLPYGKKTSFSNVKKWLQERSSSTSPCKVFHAFIDHSGLLVSALDSGQVLQPDFCPGVLNYFIFHMLPYKLVNWADTIAHFGCPFFQILPLSQVLVNVLSRRLNTHAASLLANCWGNLTMLGRKFLYWTSIPSSRELQCTKTTL